MGVYFSKGRQLLDVRWGESRHPVRYLPGHIGAGAPLTSLSAPVSVYDMHSAVPNAPEKTNRRAHLLSRNSDFKREGIDIGSLLALGNIRNKKMRGGSNKFSTRGRSLVNRNVRERVRNSDGRSQ